MKQFEELLKDYKEYCKEVSDPRTFYVWLTDGADNSFNDSDILKMLVA